MTREQIAELRISPLRRDMFIRVLDEREALLKAAKEAAEGFDIVAADDARLLSLLRDAIAKAEAP